MQELSQFVRNSKKRYRDEGDLEEEKKLENFFHSFTATLFFLRDSIALEIANTESRDAVPTKRV